jgi:glycogen debranching enzyme
MVPSVTKNSSDDRTTPATGLLTDIVAHPRQPLLHDELIVLSAPSQLWSSPDGSMGSKAIHGFYHSETRILSELALTANGQSPEHLTHSLDGAGTVRISALLRHLDDRTADPRVRVDRVRTVVAGSLSETITLSSALFEPIETSLTLTMAHDFQSVHAVKGGVLDASVQTSMSATPSGIRLVSGTVTAELSATGASVTSDDNGVATTHWDVVIPPHGSVSVSWTVTAADTAAVVTAAAPTTDWTALDLAGEDHRLQLWVDSALADLSALRMVIVAAPDQPFLAAGAPWFFTLFGRDSLWAARFLLPLETDLAGSTLRVLARLQGLVDVAATAEQPGKIMHELRPGVLALHGEDVVLPPLYFGTIDATPLWICLLVDAWKWGLPDAEVEALLPSLDAALAWMRDYGDSDGDGFLEYVDRTGHGLANQGWKDSGDSIQWRDGSLADGPIALCEVQAYAYEAAVGAAELLAHFGRPGDEWVAWAAHLQTRFREEFWVETGAERFPAVALDVHKRPVDSVTSNIGHLLGTGLLNDEESAIVAAHLVSEGLSSGFGLRTLSAASKGYWPLSYHGGAVWAHDTAIAIAGLGRAGFAAEAEQLTRGLLAAAQAFDYRMPELHSGDAASDVRYPSPYPAACRPQAWSAAAAVSVAATSLGLTPPTRVA